MKKVNQSLLSLKTFAKGIVILKACFRGLEADEKTVAVWYELTKELSDKAYLGAIRKICRDTSNIYPGTNMVALILDAAEKAWQEITPERLRLEGGYTQEQFEDGRKRLKLIIDKVGK